MNRSRIHVHKGDAGLPAVKFCRAVFDIVVLGTYGANVPGRTFA